jgi:hypothetical protein
MISLQGKTALIVQIGTFVLRTLMPVRVRLVDLAVKKGIAQRIKGTPVFRQGSSTNVTNS